MEKRFARCACPQVLYRDLDGGIEAGGWTHRPCGGYLRPDQYTPPPWPVRVFAALAPRRLYVWWFRA